MRYLVVAPSTGDNSLGRALCVAATFRRLGRVEVAARATGPLWVGASSWDLTVRVFSNGAQLLRLAERFRTPDGLTLIAIKPLPSSLGAAWWLRQSLARHGQAPWLIADLDEDDLELRRSSLRRLPRRRRLGRHLRMAVTPMPGHPLAVSRLLKRTLPHAELVTVSTTALGSAIVPAKRSVYRLPHAREPRPYAPPMPGRRLRLGFFGTVRRYKGTDTLAHLLAARPDVDLHLLGTHPPAELVEAGADVDRLIMHPQQGDTTLSAAYAATDVVLLPQQAEAPQTRLQLPAKLVDAMVFGRPVLASATPPIVEIGGDAILTVSRWDPLDEALHHLNRLRDPIERDHLARRAHSRAMAQLTTPVLAEGLRTALADAGVPT